MNKQYGLIVYYPMHRRNGVLVDAYYAVWDDLRDTMKEVVEEADDMQRSYKQTLDPRPDVIFEIDHATGDVKNACSRKELREILGRLDDDRESARREEMSDGERRAEDRSYQREMDNKARREKE